MTDNDPEGRRLPIKLDSTSNGESAVARNVETRSRTWTVCSALKAATPIGMPLTPG